MASFLGIGLGILLGRDAGGSPLVAVRDPAAAIVVLAHHRSSSNVQVDSPDELFFGLAESNAADVELPRPAARRRARHRADGGARRCRSGRCSDRCRRSRPTRSTSSARWPASPRSRSLSALGHAADRLVHGRRRSWLVLLAGWRSGVTRWSLVDGACSLGGRPRWSLQQGPTRATIWSPYYRINDVSRRNGQRAINVNGIPHQALHPVDAPKEPFYDQVYTWFPDRTYDDVLIVGAGIGHRRRDRPRPAARGTSTRSRSTRRSSRSASTHHPNQPYDDPRVTRLRRTTAARSCAAPTRQYDLVIFALPDSLTLVSTTANIRLESFLFTDEAFQTVRDHLAPDGVFVLYNYYREHWLIAKLAGMLDDAFGSPPIVRLYGAHRRPSPRARRRRARRRASRRATRSTPMPDVGDPAPTAGDRRLAVPVPADAVHRAALPRRRWRSSLLIALVRRVRGGARAAARRSASSARTSSCSASRSCCSRRAASSRFSLLFGIDLARQRAGVLRDPRAACCWRSSSTRAVPIRGRRRSMCALFGVARGRVPAPARVAAHRSAVAALRRSRRRSRSRRCSSPTSSSPTRSATRGPADMAFACNLLGAMVGGALEYVALITGYRRCC